MSFAYNVEMLQHLNVVVFVAKIPRMAEDQKEPPDG